MNTICNYYYLIRSNKSKLKLINNLKELFILKNRIGNAEDYFLQKKSANGWENVIVIMGYQNDWDACEDIKNLFMSKNRLSSYRCVPANKPPS